MAAHDCSHICGRTFTTISSRKFYSSTGAETRPGLRLVSEQAADAPQRPARTSPLQQLVEVLPVTMKLSGFLFVLSVSCCASRGSQLGVGGEGERNAGRGFEHLTRFEVLSLFCFSGLQRTESTPATPPTSHGFWRTGDLPSWRRSKICCCTTTTRCCPITRGEDLRTPEKAPCGFGSMICVDGNRTLV